MSCDESKNPLCIIFPNHSVIFLQGLVLNGVGALAFPPAPNNKRHRRHCTRRDEPAVGRLAEMLRVLKKAFVVQIIEDHRRAVVGEMHGDARPQRAGDVEHIAHQNAEEHSWQKTVKLEMDE